MKKIATYIILLATLGSAACSHTDEFGTSRHQGNELVVNAELVSTSDWKTRGGASSEVQSIECDNSVVGRLPVTTPGPHIALPMAILAKKARERRCMFAVSSGDPASRGLPCLRFPCSLREE